MTADNKQSKVSNAAATDSTLTKRIGHWIQVTVMILSAGFIFPNAMTENDEPSKNDAGK